MNHKHFLKLCIVALALPLFLTSCIRHETPVKPEENRFVKTVLTEGGFAEPTEMTILPNLDILVVERRGQIMKYDNQTKKLKQVGFLKVYYHANTNKGNTEEGLLGITADPDFKNNHYIYMYYAPIDTAVDRLSRFELQGDTIDLKSEKKILEVKTQREICCHTGGSLAFGKDNLLYLSTGDNSTPFDEPNQKYPTHAFGPMDDRPGHKQYDSRRSAGNTNDLRGKILRIKMHDDGSYTIPDGNLFPEGEAKTRPEIYVMGDRNPYRISVDKKTGYLYWGEVGPDALADSFATRGPRGYDEINQARVAGNYGWPFFVANNQAYRQHNYANNKDGYAYDPEKPINASRNNTGLMYLPPAQPAFIWYPYGISKEFPQLGSGGRTAMAGPVYHYDDYPSDTRYPEYYDGKLFIYDFIRGWIKAVTMHVNGDYDKMEGFMEHTKFSGMIDMEVGPDGRIYVLEYGAAWFTGNPEAAISRLDYLPGNRPPAVSNLKVNKTTGNLPFALHASVKATDPENDPLTYVWSLGSTKKTTKTPELDYTITTPGDYDISVEVMDNQQASTKSDAIAIYAGNEQPKVNITFTGNPHFYYPGQAVKYKVDVSDNGDKVNPANLYITSKYLWTIQGVGYGDFIPESILGKNLMLSLDCSSCHKIDAPSIGPAFKNVAKRYNKNPDATLFLPKKIIKGGSGNWGQVAMSAHPALKETDARQIVEWILSLADTVPKAKSLPAVGAIVPKPDPKAPMSTVLSLNATYTDNGGPGIKALSASKSANLRSNVMNGFEFANITGFGSRDSVNMRYLIMPADTGSFSTGAVNLSGTKGILLSGINRGMNATYSIEVRSAKHNGQVVGKGQLIFKTGERNSSAIIPLSHLVDKDQDYYLLFKQTAGIKKGLPPLLRSLIFVPAK